MQDPILLVEDTETDVLLMQHVTSRLESQPSLSVVRDGPGAITYLAGDGPFCDRREYPLPRVVILDMHLPGLNGLQVLRWIRQQASLAQLPVIMLTSSPRPTDIESAYRHGASGYIIKPPSLQDLFRIVRAIEKFWLLRDSPPPNCNEWLALNQPPPAIAPGRLLSNPDSSQGDLGEEKAQRAEHGTNRTKDSGQNWSATCLT